MRVFVPMDNGGMVIRVGQWNKQGNEGSKKFVFQTEIEVMNETE